MKKTWIFLILLALLLTACAPEKGPRETTQIPTVENVFTQPSTTSEADTQEPEDSQALGSVIIGAAGDSQKDEKGTFYTYNGGEMVLPFRVEGSGSIVCSGIGILLFVDGLPQPYKTEGTDYGFLHTFFPPDNEAYTVDLVFTPVTGKPGTTWKSMQFLFWLPTTPIPRKILRLFPTQAVPPLLVFV